MRVIKTPFDVVRQALGSRRGRVIIALTAVLALFATRARSVISNAPERSRAAVQAVTTQVRGRIGQGTTATAVNAPVAEPADAMPLPVDTPETVPAGEDENGTFRPTRAETDDFGVVVTDDAPAGLAAGNWVEGDGTPTCPDDFPIKGNANSRIYHLPGESSYERTVPELCFATEEDAAAAGYRARAK